MLHAGRAVNDIHLDASVLCVRRKIGNRHDNVFILAGGQAVRAFAELQGIAVDRSGGACLDLCRRRAAYFVCVDPVRTIRVLHGCHEDLDAVDLRGFHVIAENPDGVAAVDTACRNKLSCRILAKISVHAGLCRRPLFRRKALGLC